MSSSEILPPLTRPSRPYRALLRRLLTVTVALTGIVVLLQFGSHSSHSGHHGALSFPEEGAGFGLLFLAGFLTGFHCVGMCGPLVLSYTARAALNRRQSFLAHGMYAAGKTLSYTLLGGVFGAVGAVISFTPTMRGLAGIGAGLFLLLFGLGMLRVFPRLERIGLRAPGFLTRFIGREYRRRNHPFAIGMLNGLMILCGPLQAMYILAAGTGSVGQGAASLLVFGLGTLPVMLGFGVLTSLVSRELTPKLLRFSGYVVLALGVLMFNRGLAMSGSGLDWHSLWARWRAAWAPMESVYDAVAGVQTIDMRVEANHYVPNAFRLRKDVPVRWMIHGAALNACNRGIVVPRLGLEIELVPGEQVVEFTPTETGVIGWSCWMGVIPGSFEVYDPTEPATAAAEEGLSLARVRRTVGGWIAAGPAAVPQLWWGIGLGWLVSEGLRWIGRWRRVSRERIRFRERLLELLQGIEDQARTVAGYAGPGPEGLGAPAVAAADCDAVLALAEAQRREEAARALREARRRLKWAEGMQWSAAAEGGESMGFGERRLLIGDAYREAASVLRPLVEETPGALRRKGS